MTKYTDEQIISAAERFDRLTSTLDPDTAQVEDLSDLRAVTSAAEAALANEARLREAVRHARAHGRSWNQLAIALGVSRQAARQRFSDKVPT